MLLISLKKVLLLLFLLEIISSGHIFSSDIEISYDYNGYANQYEIVFQLESGLSNLDWIRLNWPYNLGNYDQVAASLFVYSNNLRLANKLQSDSNSENFYYYFNFNETLDPLIWYKIILYSSAQQQPILASLLVQMHTLSSATSSFIIYDLNLAFGTLFLPNIVLSESLIVSNNFPDGETNMNQPQASYIMYVDIVLTNAQTSGSIIKIMIDKGVNTNGNEESSGNQDFEFLGSCESIYNADENILPVYGKCLIDDTLYSITFELMQGYEVSQGVRIELQVQNPIYVSTRDIKVYVQSNTDGRTIENGIITGALSVNSINLILGSEKLFWGINTEQTASEIPIEIFEEEIGGVTGPLNSIYFGFETSGAIPIGFEFTLNLYVGATGVLEGNIVTNLPSADNTKIKYHYDTVTKTLICKNVGSLLYAFPYEYFIALKAFYSSDEENPSNFGGVSINSIVYNANNGLQLSGVYLYNAVTGSNEILYSNSEYLDLTGWHSSNFGLGTTQIVSIQDDTTLQATTNGIQSFMTGTNSVSVGIFPDVTTSEQLLFFLKVPTLKISTNPTPSTYTKMSILFNSDVIQFESGYSAAGIDIAAYKSSASTWLVENFPCYSSENCVWYNQVIETEINTIVYTVDEISSSNFGIAEFECGVKNSAGNNVNTNCNNFEGEGTTDGSAGIMAMREIFFPEGFQSSLYADEQVLDFVVSFSTAVVTGMSVGSYSITSAQLINAYTLNNVAMSNIKVSYVNFYGSATVYNDGRAIPMMLRVGGSVLPTEHAFASKIFVFFDSAVDSSTFYENVTDKSNFEVGCSSATCEYYREKNVIYSNENWVNSRVIQITNLPNIENEFNILIPVTNTAGKFPVSIVVAFIGSSKTSLDVSLENEVLKAYRIFGPPILGNIENIIESVNGLALNTNENLQEEMDSSFKEINSDAFNYQIDYEKITPSGKFDTTISCNSSSLTFEAGGSGFYGGGITFSSVYFNIFEYSTTNFISEPTNSPAYCSTFGYMYNNALLPSLDKKHIYTMFCAVDSTFSLNSNSADIFIKNPTWSNYFVENFPLESVFSYAVSTNNGKLIAFKKEEGVVQNGYQSCVSNETSPTIYSNSMGTERIEYSVILESQIDFDNNGINGFTMVNVIIQLSLPVTGITFKSTCEVTLPSVAAEYMSCTGSYSNGNITLLLTATSEFSLASNTNLEIEHQVSTESENINPVSNVLYNIEIEIPTVSNNIFAGNFLSVAPTFSFCSNGVFELSGNNLGVVMSINNLTYEFNEMNARGTLEFYFQASSFREIFFSFEKFVFDFGFLIDENTLLTSSNSFRCFVMSSENEISWLWESLIFNDLRNVVLNPKTEFLYPNNSIFIMRCQAGATPNSGASVGTNIKASYEQPSAILESSNPDIVFSSEIITSARTFLVAPGADAFYSFELQSNVPLTSSSRIYIEFPFGIPPKLNREGFLDCYIKLQLNDNSTAICEESYERELIVWVNQNIAANTNFYLDIYGVTEPRTIDIKITSSSVWIGIDEDNDRLNGINAHGTVTDTEPDSTTVVSMPIINLTVTNTFVNEFSDFEMTIQIPTGEIENGNNLYVDFPGVLAEELYRGMETQCYVYNLETLNPNNFAGQCSFISKKRIQISLFTDISNNPIERVYNVTIKNIPTPSNVPYLINNFIKIIPFIASTDERVLTYLGIDYRTNLLSYQNDPEKENLIWNFYTFSNDYNNNLNVEFSSEGSADIYIGYYNKLIELKPETNGILFSTDFEIEFLNEGPFVFNTNNFNVFTGTANLRFGISAEENTAEGIYILEGQKSSGDENSIYTQPPTLQLTVKQVTCQINPSETNYNIPIGGESLPIILDFFNCFPVNDITVVPNFGGNTEVVVDSSTQINKITSSSSNSRIIFVVKETSEITIGTVINMHFEISGTNAISFGTPESVTLTFIDENLGEIETTGIENIIATENNVEMTIGCNEAASIYWVYGITPSISAISVDTIEKTLFESNGMMQNYTDVNDVYYWKVFGEDILSNEAGTINKEFTGLKSNSSYEMNYFCINELQEVYSSGISSFFIENNGGYLLKLTLYFENVLTYAEDNEIACSLAQSFAITKERVFTEEATSCGETSVIISESKLSSLFSKEFTNISIASVVYPYYFYVLPDYSSASDFTNFEIRSEISQESFNKTLMQKTATPENYPVLYYIQSEEATASRAPNVNAASASTTLTTIKITVLLQSASGYIIIGVKEGARDMSKPLPTANMIKNGFYDTNMPLIRVEMIFSEFGIRNEFEFTGLNEKSEYTFYIAGTSDDPSEFALSSNILIYTFTTADDSAELVVNSSRLVIRIWVVIFMILSLIF